jgi:hypothetical protein
VKGPLVIVVGLLKLYHYTRNAVLCAGLYAVLLGFALWIKFEEVAPVGGGSLLGGFFAWAYFKTLDRVDDESWKWWLLFFAGGLVLSLPLV